MSGNGKQKQRVKRVRLTLQEKLQVIDFVNGGKTHAQAAEKFNASRTSITQMMKDEVSIRQALKEN